MTSNDKPAHSIRQCVLPVRKLVNSLWLTLLAFSGCHAGDDGGPLNLVSTLDGVSMTCVRFIDDSNRFVSFGRSGDYQSREIRVWEVGQQKPLTSISAYTRDFVVDLDGSTIYGINGKYRIEKWDLQAGLSPGLYYEDPSVEFHSIAMSDDGKFLVAGSGMRKPEPEKPNVCDVWLWDLCEPSEPVRFKGHLAPVNGVALSSDNTILLSASVDGTFRRWDIETKEEIAIEGTPDSKFDYPNHAPERIPIKFSSDDAMVLYDLEVWDILRWEKLRTLGASIPRSDRRHGFEMVTDAAFVTTTKFVLTTLRDGMVRLWDAETGSLLESAVAGENLSQATTVTVASDGSIVVTGANGSIPGWEARRQGVPPSDQHSLRVWDLRLPSAAAAP